MKRWTSLIVSALLGITLAGCKTLNCWGGTPAEKPYYCKGSTQQPPQVVPTDAGPYSPPDGPATCLDVCRNGQAHGCSWAQDTDAGATCVDVCANVQNGPAPWDLNCRARKTTCAAIDTCN